MRRLLLLSLLAALGSSIPICMFAQDDAKKPGQAEAAKTPADDLKAIQQDFNKKQQDFITAYRAAKTQEDRQKILKEQRPDPKSFVERGVKLAEANPDSPASQDALFWALQMGSGSPAGKKAEELLAQGFIAKAPLAEVASKLQRNRLFGVSKLFDALLARVEAKLDDPAAPKLLTWINSNTMYGPPSKAGEKATQLLLEKFFNDDSLATVCQNLGNGAGNAKESINQLRSVINKSSNKTVLASAHFGLASLLKDQDVSTQDEAKSLYQTVIDVYGENSGKLAGQAKQELKEMAIRGLGKTVPEIKGKDLQDKEFKISDYRGKVVLIDFWGFW